MCVDQIILYNGREMGTIEIWRLRLMIPSKIEKPNYYAITIIFID